MRSCVPGVAVRRCARRCRGSPREPGPDVAIQRPSPFVGVRGRASLEGMRSATPHDPASLATTEDAGRALGRDGEGWEAAIALGIDVTLIERNLALSPAERMRQADEDNRLASEIQSRTVPEPVRARLARDRLEEKRAALEATVGLRDP
jgi:hypothetical protein